jgi:hypothetical protein
MNDRRFRAMKARHEVRKLKFDNDTDTGREMLPIDIQDITELIAEVERLQAAIPKETERCAKLAEGVAKSAHRHMHADTGARLIARLIRGEGA